MALLFLGSEAAKSGGKKSDGSYPYVDDDGYSLAYSKWGRWVNWWREESPGLMSILRAVATTEVTSLILHSMHPVRIYAHPIMWLLQ